MFKVQEIAFVGYPVTDLTRARAFYEGVLGFTPVMCHDQGTGKGFVEYEFGPHTLSLAAMEGDQWLPSPQGPCAALEVEDFDAAVAHLREKGVSFVMEPFASPVCRMCLIADPDGNQLCIHKRNPSSAPSPA